MILTINYSFFHCYRKKLITPTNLQMIASCIEIFAKFDEFSEVHSNIFCLLLHMSFNLPHRLARSNKN